MNAERYGEYFAEIERLRAINAELLAVLEQLKRDGLTADVWESIPAAIAKAKEKP